MSATQSRRIARSLFAAVPDTPEHENALLSAMLASALAPLPNGADLAITAGRNWGHVLVERLEPGQQPDEETCIARVSALLRSRGFAPETTARDIILRRCPFRDLADRYPDVRQGWLGHSSLAPASLTALPLFAGLSDEQAARVLAVVRGDDELREHRQE